MTVASRGKLQLNPWPITLEGIIIIAHKLKAVLNYRCFSNIWWVFFFPAEKREVVKIVSSKKA